MVIANAHLGKINMSVVAEKNGAIVFAREDAPPWQDVLDTTGTVEDRARSEK